VSFPSRGQAKGRIYTRAPCLCPSSAAGGRHGIRSCPLQRCMGEGFGGEPNRDKIALTILEDKVRELI